MAQEKIPSLEEFLNTTKTEEVAQDNTLYSKWCRSHLDQGEFAEYAKLLGYPYFEWDNVVFKTSNGQPIKELEHEGGDEIEAKHGTTTFQVAPSENAYATMTGTPGMGPITSPQPGNQPGHIGSFGSGDISGPLSSIGTGKHPANTIAGSMFATSKDDDTKEDDKKKKSKSKDSKKKSQDERKTKEMRGEVDPIAGHGYEHGKNNPANDKSFDDTARYTAGLTYRMYPRQQKKDGKHNKLVDAMMRKIMSGEHNWSLDASMIESNDFLYSDEKMSQKLEELDRVSHNSVFWAKALIKEIQAYNSTKQKKDDLCKVNDIRVEPKGQNSGLICFHCTTPSKEDVTVTCLAEKPGYGDPGAYDINLDPQNYDRLRQMNYSELSPDGPFAEHVPLYGLKKYLFE